MNRFVVIGRLIKDAETRYTKEGKSVSTFTLAINNTKEDVTFLKITTFNGTSELIKKYTKKGDLISVEGMIKNNNYEDKDGNKHYDYIFIGNNVEFLSKSKIENKEENKETNSNKIYEEFGNGEHYNEKLSL